MADYSQSGSIVSTATVSGWSYAGAILVAATVVGSLVAGIVQANGFIVPIATVDGVNGGGGVADTRTGGSIISTPIVAGDSYTGGVPTKIIVTPTLRGQQLAAIFEVAETYVTPLLDGQQIVDARETQSIIVTPTIDGQQLRGSQQTGSIVAVATLSGSSRLHLVSSGSIFAHAILTGTQIASTAAQVSADAQYRADGHLPYFPIVVYMLNVQSSEDVGALEFGRAFLVAGDYSGLPGDLFYESGANAGFVGYKLGSTASPHYVFRAPYPWECVWSIEDGVIYRNTLNRDTGRWGWVVYRTLPQRYLDSVRAFEQFDPDRIYDYFAKLVGAVHGQMSQDNATFAKLRNPDSVPAALIPYAASAVGAKFNATLDSSKQRAALALAVPTSRARGLSEAVSLYMRQYGYVGWAAEVWTRIAWASVVLTGYDSVSSSDINNLVVIGSPDGRTVVYCRSDIKPGVDTPGASTLEAGYSSDTTSLAADLLLPYPSISATVASAAAALSSASTAFGIADLVTGLAQATIARDLLQVASTEIAGLALVSDPLELSTRASYLYVLQKNFIVSVESQTNTDLRTLKNGVKTIYRFSATSAGGVISVTDGADADAVMAHLASAMNGHDGAGSAQVIDSSLPIAIDVPHNYSVSEPGIYWASPFVTIHLNAFDGSPLDITNQIVQTVSPEMLNSVLPVACRIHAFATDIPVETEDVSYFDETIPGTFSGVAVQEQFSITQV